MSRHEIPGSRFKAVLHVAFGTFLVTLGWLMTKLPESQRMSELELDIVGWFLIAVGALLSIEYLMALIKPPTLRLDTVGFCIKMPLFPERRFLWSAITEIYLDVRRGSPQVRWKFDKSGVPKGRIKLDGALPKIWTQPPEALVVAMQQFWEVSRKKDGPMSEC